MASFFFFYKSTAHSYNIHNFSLFFLSDTLYIIINYIIIYGDTNLLVHVLN